MHFSGIIEETNAYCWVDIVVNSADAWVRFEGKPDARCSMTFDPETGTMRFFKPGAAIILR